MAIIQSIPLSGSGGSGSTYTNMTTDEAIAGTNTEERVISAKVLNDAIDNKIPTIPTVNNAKLTIQKNGTTVKTFTANASANVTCNIEVPTKVSDLDNDSGFLTEHQDISGLETKANAITGLSVNGKVITYTKGDGSTGTITTQDTNTTYTAMSASEATTGTSTTARSISAKVLNDKIKEMIPDISGKADSATTLGGYGITDAYTKSQVDKKVSDLVSSAPETLDTLNELASALGNDPNFATTVATQIGNKADDDKVVHTSGDETIAGAKTFTNVSLNQTASKPYFNIKSTSADLDTDPSSSIIYGLRYYDKNNQLMSYMAQDQVNNGNNALIFQVYNKPLASESNPTPASSSKRIGYYIGRDFNAYFGPSVNKASDLGTAQYLWGNVYSENYYGTNLGSSNSVFASSYVTTYYGTNMGTAANPFDKVYSSKIGSSATPVANLYATTIGAAGSPVTDLYVTNFHGSIDSATKASQNASGNELSNTIIKGLSISGTTITYTKLDGTTGTLTTQDTNTTYSNATTKASGLMSYTDKIKLDGLSNYTLPTAGSTLGGVKTTSTVTDVSTYTACPIDANGVPYYKDTNTTYSSMSASEATTGTATTARSISAKVLNDKISTMLPTKVSDLDNDSNFAINTNVVHLTGNETISGLKNFNEGVRASGTQWKNTTNTTEDITGFSEHRFYHQRFSSGKLSDLSDGAWDVSSLGAIAILSRFNTDYDIRFKHIANANSTDIYRFAVIDKSGLYQQGNFHPKTDNTYSSGTSTNKWKDVYATTLHGDVDFDITEAQIAAIVV